ncbi:hypothetical protein AB5I39_00100 [Sphingomonas sp. MMS24-J45]|uniref:hypothetical protein n=1 Tax=Sphingomonas sp. MMS24-J45 TaxID=3238806 RepID=UPI00384F351F
MFRLDYDVAINVLTIHVEGFWTPEMVPELSAALLQKAQALKVSGRSFDVLVELLDFPVQSNEVADLLTGVMTAGFAYTSGRAAVVVGSHLNKLQAERTLVHPRLRVFRSLDEGRAWLAGFRAAAA